MFALVLQENAQGSAALLCTHSLPHPPSHEPGGGEDGCTLAQCRTPSLCPSAVYYRDHAFWFTN